MAWDKIKIKDNSGNIIEAQAPVIVSASRSTDVPAFYSDWLVQRINEGYVKWENPFNGAFLYVSFAKVRVMVFWSKNPKPMIKHLDFFDQKIKNYYFQFTLNDYDIEKLEPAVPDVQSRIETFIKLSERLGKDKVIWRFDPLILTDKIGIDELLGKVERIGNQLINHTSKLVFSYADIKIYTKVQNNLRRSSIKYQEFNERLMNDFAAGLQILNSKWNFQIGTCAEKIPLEKYGIVHNKCIDDDLIIKLFHQDRVLMDFLKVKITEPELFQMNLSYLKQRDNKDKGQREACGCIISKDIGEYNTCPHFCEYCYANTSRDTVIKNSKQYKENPNCEMIKGQ
jgi:DNA repair photolyase